jgi:hypothetical protein
MVEDSGVLGCASALVFPGVSKGHVAVFLQRSLSLKIKVTYSFEMPRTSDGIPKYKIKYFKLQSNWIITSRQGLNILSL